MLLNLGGIMKGLNSNKLKVIAIVLMIIDHVGYYFVSYISPSTFNVLRFIGRIAMPIFAYLLVQGFFHTHNLKKYIFKIFSVATLFQILLIVLGVINKLYVSNYYIIINTYLNILYSFVFCLIILAMIDKKQIVNNKIIDIAIRIFVILAMLLIYQMIDVELGYRVVVTIVGFYFAEKLKILKGEKTTEAYVIVLFVTLVLAVFADYKNLVFNLPSIISIIPITMYNGQRGSNSKTLKNIFYVIYPLHHIILYILALYITHKVR